MRRSLTPIVAALLLLLAPSIAEGATIGRGQFSGELLIVASAAEVNQLGLRVSEGTGDEVDVVVTDAGTPPVAGPGCEEVGDEVRCQVPSLYIIQADVADEADVVEIENLAEEVGISLRMGPGDDRASAVGVGQTCIEGGDGDDGLQTAIPTKSCSLSGGEGNDELTGSAGQDRLYGDDGEDHLEAGGGPDYTEGGRGADEMHGGPGSDISLAGGEGADVIEGGSGADWLIDDPGDDRYLGGTGNDTFSAWVGPNSGDDSMLGQEGRDRLLYLCPACELRLDRLANDGWRDHESDLIVVEDAVLRSLLRDEDGSQYFGTGEDIVIGNDQANAFRTERGADLVVGRGGADLIRTGYGPDTVRAADGIRDEIDCGAGTDRARVDSLDRSRNCEVLRVVEPPAP